MTIKIVAEASIPTNYGDFIIVGFEGFEDGKEHFAMVRGDIAKAASVLVRIHSECMTGDVFGSLRCDCGPQLKEAQRLVAESGCGVILYLRQEGRNIGLVNKMRAYALQDQGHDTVDANILQGLPVDGRSYDVAIGMLNALGVRGGIKLLTNNPDKVAALQDYGFEVTRVPLQTYITTHSARYMDTKRVRMGHQLRLPAKRF